MAATAGRPGLLAVAAASLLVLDAPAASAFDSKGHIVIEALAYRTLIEGHDGQPPRPDVLRDLFDDGALAPPLCFGWGDASSGFLRRRDDDQPAARLAGAPDRRARRGLPAAVQRRRPVLSLHGDARGRRIPRPRGNHDSARPRDLGAGPVPRFPRQPHAPGRPRRRARDAQGRLRPLRADALRRRLLLGIARAAPSDDRSDRGAPHLEAPDAPAGTLLREDRADPRLRVPQVGRPPRQDLRRRGPGHASTGAAARTSPTLPTRCPTSACPKRATPRGRPSSSCSSSCATSASRTRRHPRPPRCPPRLHLHRPRNKPRPGAPTRTAGSRPSIPARATSASSISPPTSLPARTRSSASTRPTTRRASSSTSRAR